MWQRGNSENIQQTGLQSHVLNTNGYESSSEEEPGKLSGLIPTYTDLKAVEEEDSEPDTDKGEDSNAW